MSYSAIQVARKLNISRNTVHTYCRSGKIKAIKIPKLGRPGFKYLIEGDDFLRLLNKGPISRGPQEVGTRLGPFRITRVDGNLITERV